MWETLENFIKKWFMIREDNKWFSWRTSLFQLLDWIVSYNPRICLFSRFFSLYNIYFDTKSMNSLNKISWIHTDILCIFISNQPGALILLDRFVRVEHMDVGCVCNCSSIFDICFLSYLFLNVDLMTEVFWLLRFFNVLLLYKCKKNKKNLKFSIFVGQLFCINGELYFTGHPPHCSPLVYEGCWLYTVFLLLQWIKTSLHF